MPAPAAAWQMPPGWESLQGVSYIFRSSLLMTQRPVQCQKKVDIGAFQPICKLAGNEGIDGIGRDGNDGHDMSS